MRERVFENRQVRASRLVMVVIMARWTMASWWSGLVSSSRTQRRCLLIHAKLLSTTQMRGRTWKPAAPGMGLMMPSKGENVCRPDEQPSGVTAVGPDQPDGGEAGA